MTQPRNRDVGRGGHATQFASRDRRDAVTSLTGREPADHTDIDRYFAGGIRDILDAPWVDDNLWPPYAPQDWAEVDVVRVAPSGMYRTQQKLLKSALKRHAAGGPTDGGDPHPWIIRYRRRSYVFDGHHRVATAVHNGDATIAVRLVDMDA